MAKKKIKLIIFDYDDTLIERNFDNLFPKNLKNKREIINFIKENVSKIKDIKETFKRAFDFFKLPYNEKILNVYVKKYISIYKNGKIRNSIKRLLRVLAKKYCLVILTNGSKQLKIEELKKNNVYHLFKDIITSREIGYEKPSKEAFLYVLKKYKARPIEVVSIGNSYSFDIAPAKSLGMKTIWIRKNVADLIIKNLEDLNEKDISKL